MVAISPQSSCQLDSISNRTVSPSICRPPVARFARGGSQGGTPISKYSIIWGTAAADPVQHVTSSCLCKEVEGAAQRLLHGLQVQPAPVLVESVKDGIEDSLHALHVGEQDHGPGAPADFDEGGSAPGVHWV